MACAADADCTAFGHYGASATSTPTGYFTLTGSGSNLSVDQATTFLVWPGNPWEHVRCPQAAMVCLTGYDGPGSQSLALGWGPNWTTTELAVPGGEPANVSMHLVGMACAATTSCVVLLAGTLATTAGPGPGQFNPQNAVVQPVSLPDLTPTTPSTTAPGPVPAAVPTTLPPFPAAPTTAPTVPSLRRSALGALAAKRQPLGTATVVLAVVGGLLLVVLVGLVGGDRPGPAPGGGGRRRTGPGDPGLGRRRRAGAPGAAPAPRRAASRGADRCRGVRWSRPPRSERRARGAAGAGALLPRPPRALGGRTGVPGRPAAGRLGARGRRIRGRPPGLRGRPGAGRWRRAAGSRRAVGRGPLGPGDAAALTSGRRAPWPPGVDGVPRGSPPDR